MKVSYILHEISPNVNDNIRKVLDIIEIINKNEPNNIPFAPYLTDAMPVHKDEEEFKAKASKNIYHIFSKAIIDEVRIYGTSLNDEMRTQIKWANNFGIPVLNLLNIDLSDEIYDIQNDSGVFNQILNTVCNEFLISENDLKLSSRKGNLVMARHMFIGLNYNLIKKTRCTSLGKYLNRDHSTILYGHEQFKNLMFSDKGFKEVYNRILDKINL